MCSFIQAFNKYRTIWLNQALSSGVQRLASGQRMQKKNIVVISIYMIKWNFTFFTVDQFIIIFLK